MSTQRLSNLQIINFYNLIKRHKKPIKIKESSSLWTVVWRLSLSSLLLFNQDLTLSLSFQANFSKQPTPFSFLPSLPLHGHESETIEGISRKDFLLPLPLPLPLQECSSEELTNIFLTRTVGTLFLQTWQIKLFNNPIQN